jgi:outer membrane protein OmpA-like peptidoglycan-associated protein
VPALICVADLMMSEPQIKVGVQAAPGIELGAERAEAICNWLVEQGGVSISRLRVTEARRAGGSGSAAVRAATADQGSGSSGEDGTWHVRFHVIAEVKISDRLEFDGGSDELREESKETLKAVAQILQTRRDVPRLTVEGHTCSDGPEVWNMQLSRQRAESVQRFLREDCGVSRERLNVTGFGPRRPLVEGHMGRRRNRRVEFLVM